MAIDGKSTSSSRGGEEGGVEEMGGGQLVGEGGREGERTLTGKLQSNSGL